MTIDILTLALAVIVALITYGQFQTAKLNLKHQLFEKRYEVYEQITAFLADAQISGRVDSGREIELLRETKRAYFLFSGNADVKNLISDIYSHAVNLQALDAELQGEPPGAGRTENVEQQRQIKEWMQESLNSMESRFEKYLKLEH
ncbi:MAG: hypothetical protein AAF662_06025 [Pseudomonadota bacterium]